MTDTEALASCREVLDEMDKIVDDLHDRIEELEEALDAALTIIRITV